MTADPINLALADHYRAGFEGDPSRSRCDLWERERSSGDAPARSYVTIADHHRLIAIYSVRRNGRLFRLTRWPSYLRFHADPSLQRACRRRQAELEKVSKTPCTHPALSSVEPDTNELAKALRMLKTPPDPVRFDLNDIDMEDLDRTLAELDGL